MPETIEKARCRVAVIWIDWYAYHVARFRGLESVPALSGRVCGIELVGGIGVHAGLKFREALPADLAVDTLMPEQSWRDANHWALARMLWVKLTELDPEVVLVPGYYTLPGFASAIWARVHGRTSVLMTESTAGDHTRVWWKELLKSSGLHLLFDWAVYGGKAHLEYLRELGFAVERTVGFYDVVDNDMFEQGTTAARQSFSEDASSQGKYFLYVGRLAEEKNVSGLLKSWLEYRQQGGSWPLMLVGDGPERKHLEAAAQASPFGNEVSFPGLKSSHELLPFYARAGCFILPSTREPWGLVVNEAMASGLPVIVSKRCGCAIDLVHEGLNGFTFDPEQGAELVTHMLTIEQLPANDYAMMCRYSSDLVRGYSPRRFGGSILHIAESTSEQGRKHVLVGGSQ